MIRRFSAALFAALTLIMLSACGAGSDVSVWRPLSQYYLSGGCAVECESVRVDGSLGEIDAAVEAFNSHPSDSKYVRALPEGVEVLGWQLSDGELRLDVSPEYAALSGWARSLADCCAVLTFCSIEGVESVSVYSGDTMLTAAQTPDKLLLEDNSGLE